MEYFPFYRFQHPAFHPGTPGAGTGLKIEKTEKKYSASENPCL